MTVVHVSTAQNFSNERTKILTRLTDTLAKDTLTIAPETVTLKNLESNNLLDTNFYEVKNTLILNKVKSVLADNLLLIADSLKLKGNRQQPRANSYELKYRVLPFNLGKSFYRIDSSVLINIAPKKPFEADYARLTESDIFNKELSYAGNYTQGLSLGNTQNLVVNQNFNLNINGKIGDVDVLASMTDNNVPLQAQGNTLQLRDFDRIFIQLKKQNNTLIAGDFELNRPQNGYFVNYFKKLQGASFFNDERKTMNDEQKKQNNSSFIVHRSSLDNLSSKVSIGIAKGKFARNILPVQEGNQGPYRLIGNENSSFFIILSGTEKVFYDGKQLLRGEENDYVIDYNAGNIAFTPKRLVTKDSRIVVEFEYADQNYLRSTAAFSSVYTRDKTKIFFNAYSEQDSKNSTGTQSLDSLDKIILRTAGNNPDLAVSPSIAPLVNAFQSDRVQYKLVDSLVSGTVYKNVLVYSNDAALAKYQAVFTPVGNGKGNYIIATNITNGRVYEWIAPDNKGNLQGNYEPVKKLVPPNQQQMFSIGASFVPIKNVEWTIESALSRFNANLFSEKGDSAGVGLALFSKIKTQHDLDEKKTLEVQSEFNIEATQRNFKALNPYRSTEFSRDWNLSSSAPSQTAINITSGLPNTFGDLNTTTQAVPEQWLSGNINLIKKDWGNVLLNVSEFLRDSLYQGVRRGVKLNFSKSGYNFQADINDLNSKSIFEKTFYTRPNWHLSKSFSEFNIGFGMNRERNERRDITNDTLLRTAFYYDIYQAQIEKSGKNPFSVRFSKRYDYLPNNNLFKKITSVDELGITGQFAKRSNHILIWNMTYRNLNVNDSTLTAQTAQKTYLGRIEYIFNFWKNAVGGNTLYEIGSGREQKIEYQYIKVNKGEGQYIWRRKGNDSIPKLNEFELAPFSDQGEYVRVSLYSNEFIRTNNVSFTQTLRLEPKLFFQDVGHGILDFGNTNNQSPMSNVQLLTSLIQKFSFNGAVSISRRVKNDALNISQWNPFQLNISDTALVALNTNGRYSLFFNRGNSFWDMELGQTNTRNRVVLITGFEERARDETFWRQRWNINTKISLLNFVSEGTLLNESEAFLDRNYTQKFYKLEPQIQWLVTNNLRFILAYKYRTAKNVLRSDGENIQNNNFSLEATWNQTSDAQIRAKFSSESVKFSGDVNTPIAFAFLEGLQNGQNFIWNINFDKNLSKNLLFSLSYEGRKIGDINTVHVGRVQVRASF